MTLSYKDLFVIIIIVVLSFQLSSAMDICKEKDKPNFKLKLLGTALFKDYLLLITREDLNYTVYKISFDNFGNSYGQMYIGAAGVPIEQYWPMFKSATTTTTQTLTTTPPPPTTTQQNYSP